MCDICNSTTTTQLSKNFLNLCVECQHPAVTVSIELSLLFLFCVLVYCIAVLQPGSKRRLFLCKVVLNYWQFLYISKAFNAKTPLWFRIGVSVFEAPSLLMRNMLDSSCLFLQMNLTFNHQFANLILSTVFFAIMLIVVALVCKLKFQSIFKTFF